MAWSPEGPSKLGEVAGLGAEGDEEDGEHGSLRQQRSGHPVPGHRRAGLKAGQQHAGAGNCGCCHGGGPGHHGRTGGRARKQHRSGLSNKLEGVVATKSTPDGVDLSCPTTAPRRP